MQGRALAITTAVTLLSNTIDNSICSNVAVSSVKVTAAASVAQSASPSIVTHAEHGLRSLAALGTTYTPIAFGSTAGFTVDSTQGQPSAVRIVSPSLDASTTALLAQPGRVAQAFYVSSAYTSVVPLGASQSCAVIAAATITNSGSSSLLGDLALTGTAIVGAPAVSGISNVANAAAAAAMLAASNAYTLLKGLTCNTLLPSQELGGLTLTPGVYCWTGANVQITGNLVLDAQGNPNAHFVFQIAGILTVPATSTVKLINGGSVCNVFWAVSSAVLMTNVQFTGTITAYAAITLQLGARVTGRLVTTTAAIGLAQSVVDNSQCLASGVVLATSSAPAGQLAVTNSGLGSYYFVVADTTPCSGIANCVSCSSSTQCSACADGFSLSIDRASCGAKCGSQEYSSKGMCFTCASALPGCATCGNEFVCSTMLTPVEVSAASSLKQAGATAVVAMSALLAVSLLL
jgi:hypothetical protein